MGNKKLWTTFSCLVLSLVSFTQNFYFRQLKPEDGLPSSIVYQVAQDSKGILWMGTENGLCAFDGQSFIYYTVQDGLPNNVVHRLAIDQSDHIWLTTLAPQPAMFANGKCLIPSWADSLHLDSYSISATPDSLIWIISTNSGRHNNTYARPLVVVGPSETYQEFDSIRYAQTSVFHLEGTNILFRNKGTHFDGQKMSRIVENQFEGYASSCSVGKTGVFCFINKKEKTGKLNRSLAKVDVSNGTILQTIQELKKYDLTQEANSLYADKQGHIWIGLRNGLLFLEHKGGVEYKDQLLLDGVFVNRIFEDHEGNIWIGTEGDGCYMLISTRISTLLEGKAVNKGTICSLVTDEQGTIYIGYNNGVFEQYDSQFQLVNSIKIPGRRIIDIHPDSAGVWLGANSEVLRLDRNGQILFRSTAKHGVKCLQPFGDRLFVLSTQLVEMIEEGLSPSLLDLGARTYCAYPKNDSMLWLGSTEGLSIYNTKQNLIRQFSSQINSDIRAILPDNEGRFWIATLGQGLLLIDEKGIVQQFSKEDGLSSDICNDLVLDGHYVWVGTNMGISRLNLVSMEIEVFGIGDGLISQEVNYLVKFGNNILAATDNNLNIIPTDIKKYIDPPLLHLGIVRLDMDTMDLAESYTVPFYKNDLFVSFQGISYKSLGQLNFFYKMEGLDADWIETTAAFANWSSIPPGDYLLRIKVKGSNHVWSEEQQIQFTFEPPFWNRSWFRLFLLFGLSGGVLLIFTLVVRNLKRKNALQKRIQELQLTALRAQMNPHFMFNALNSIQEYINRNDQEQANLYLSQFAALVRQTLNNSTKSEISLAEEIEQLELYLNLENLRFDNSIQFELVLNPSLHKEAIFIPSMLIQPFVENAIIHGLFHKEGPKKLTIHFLMKMDGILKCYIKDNGVGRVKSAEINQRRKYRGQPKGVSVTRERLEIMNNTNDRVISVVIEDLINPITHQGIGTVVNLSIPFTQV